MFVYYFVQVPLSMLETWARLERALDDLGDWAHDAYRTGETITAKAGPDGSHVAKTVAIRLHDASVGDGTVTLPMVWTATGTPGLFPRLEADLVVGAVDADSSQIALRGSYTPPLGSIGRALDRLVFHRIAESTVKAFVDRIAAAVVANGPVSADA